MHALNFLRAVLDIDCVNRQVKLRAASRSSPQSGSQQISRPTNGGTLKNLGEMLVHLTSISSPFPLVTKPP